MTWSPILLFHQLHMWKYKALHFIKNFEVKMEWTYKRNLISTGDELICYLLLAYPTAQNSV